MIRLLRIITVILVLVANSRLGSAQSSAATLSSQSSRAEATQLNQEVEKLLKEGKLQAAVAPAEKALALREQALGPTDPDVATSLNNLAEVYRAQGFYAKAEPLSVRALAIREKAFGPTHPDVATSLHNLAALYQAQGAYIRAESLYVRALAIRENAFGSSHPDVAESVSGLASLYEEQGAYPKAEPLYVRALTISERALGPMHPDVARSLINLAALYQEQGAYSKAEPLYVRALAISEKALGPTHPDVATNLDDLAILYGTQGEYGKAEPLMVRALAIREKVLGPTHPDVATSLNNLATLYWRQGAYIKAEPLMVRALAIREKVLGSTHPDVANSLLGLAELHQARGAYSDAESLLVRALDIREKALGPAHPGVATILQSLAGLYQAKGAYAKAEPLLVRTLAIFEKALGPMHPEVATSLGNLAWLFQTQDAYAKAEPLLIRALDIFENTFGPTHPEVATSLNNLALLYEDQGAYGKAEPLLIRALAINEKTLGPAHPDVATCLNNLALLYEDQGAHSKAEALNVRALAILEKALGPTHPLVAENLNNIAEMYRAQGAYDRAEPLYVRALAIFEKALGPTHSDVAITLNNLARLYQARGAHSKAESLYIRALAIRENVLGSTHPELVVNLNDLAWLYRAQGAAGKAELLAARAAEIREQQLRTEFTRLSESRKRALMALLQGETDGLVSLHADAMRASAPALELALTTVLRRKGRILDSLIDSESRLRAHLTPDLREQLDQLTQARTDLTSLLYAFAGTHGAVDRDAVTAARTQIDELDSALSAASAEFRVESEPITVAKIRATLPPGAALVEFVRYRRFDAQRVRPWQEARYVAYLVMPRGAAQWVSLGAAATIDTAIDAALAMMDGRVTAASAKAALSRLDALVFAPISARLAGVSHVILAPDGKLNLVPFEALIDSQGHYELEKYLVSYVTTGRDLLRLAATQQPRSSAVVVADPDYGPLPPLAEPAAVSFAPLAGARAEATDLRPYFGTPLLGAQATKAALTALAGPVMLHIATHGFYARDPSRSLVHTASQAPGTALIRRESPRPPLRRTRARRDSARGMFVDGGDARWLPPPGSNDPVDGLDRAGLAMAGANQGASGIVTAREIAGFDWQGTQLVVLSACETGVGAVSSSDGVYGLRRALVLAGTASQVVSLWSVSDVSTRQLMRDYYFELARGTGRAEALRQAKLRLIHEPRYSHPYYWAAFIPAGDWRPLDTSGLSRGKSQP